jgi:hypothetical protein
MQSTYRFARRETPTSNGMSDTYIVNRTKKEWASSLEFLQWGVVRPAWTGLRHISVEGRGVRRGLGCVFKV